jgi:hypothetical protein
LGASSFFFQGFQVYQWVTFFFPLLFLLLVYLKFDLALKLVIPFFLILLFASGKSMSIYQPDSSEALSFWGNLLCLFWFFRLISFWIAYSFRGIRTPLEQIFEYFYSPAFFLFPSMGTVLVMDRFQNKKEPEDFALGIRWMVRGVVHCILLTAVLPTVLPFLAEIYGAGWRKFSLLDFFQMGGLLFLLSYIDKSRNSFLVAGIFQIRVMQWSQISVRLGLQRIYWIFGGGFIFGYGSFIWKPFFLLCFC